MNKTEIDRIKRDIPILEVAKGLGLEIKGTQARCFNTSAHKNGDKNPSLGFDIPRNRFKCFSCQINGSVIDLVMQVQGVDFNKAIQYLGGDIGALKAPFRYDLRVKPKQVYPQEITPLEKPILGAYKEIYEDLFIYSTATPEGEVLLDEEALAYLTGRGFNKDTLTRFNVFSIKNYKKTEAYLKSKYSLDELQQAGLFNEKGYFAFNGYKIIFPFMSEGRIIFLQGRRLDNTPPKYKHLKGHGIPLFNLEVLEGLQNIKIHIAEGVLDTLAIEQTGRRAVGIIGVHGLKEAYIPLFKDLEIVLCLDNDESGRSADKKYTELFFKHGQRVKVKKPPDGFKDFTEYLLENKK
jgi:DNA primase